MDAVQYGFWYATESQNDGKSVPQGNIEQWLMNKKKINTLGDLNKFKGIGISKSLMGKNIG